MREPTRHEQALIAAIDDCLPQTQCRQCGTEGCEAYARAIVMDKLPFNRCAPGGAAGIERLAALLHKTAVPLDPEFGVELPFAVARIDVKRCIGCSWCIKVCPTDAIAGAPKHLHGVIEPRCTGCSLCLPACPVDCIDMVENGAEWGTEQAHRARDAFRARRTRLAAQERADAARLEALGAANPNAKSALLAAVMAKARNTKTAP